LPLIGLAALADDGFKFTLQPLRKFHQCFLIWRYVRDISIVELGLFCPRCFLVNS
jgi:hypothetical protein